MHRIDVDLATGIIEVEFIGFWGEDDVQAFASDLALHTERVAATGRAHLMLYDYSRATIQAQNIISALQRLVQNVPRRAARIALFTSGQLARLQAKRIATVRSDIRTFETREAAVDWLLEMAEPLPRGVAATPAISAGAR